MQTDIYFDGACDPNPGFGGAGVYLTAPKLGVAAALGRVTNNEAEWQALTLGIERALALGYTQLRVIGDSQLVLNCASGRWQTHKPHLQHLKALSDRAIARAGSIEFIWVRREYNCTADKLSKQGRRLAPGSSRDFPGLVFLDPSVEDALRLTRSSPKENNTTTPEPIDPNPTTQSAPTPPDYQTELQTIARELARLSGRLNKVLTTNQIKDSQTNVETN